MMIKTINDVESLYDQPVVESNGDYFCPVCDKKYKTILGVENHMKSKDCYKVKDMFKGTLYEESAHEFMNCLSSGTIGINIFRKSKMYAPLIRFMVLCSLHQVKSPDLYFDFVDQIKGNRKKSVRWVLSQCMKETMIREYRLFLQKNDHLIDTNKFLDKYRGELVEDPRFLIRSIEKSHIGIITILASKDTELLEAMDNLPTDYYNRLGAIYDAITQS